MSEKNNETQNITPAPAANNQNILIICILAAAILITGALVFLGVRMGNSGGSSGSDLSFAEQLAEYEAAQMAAEEQAYLEQQELAQEQAKGVKPIADVDHVLGDANAKVTIFEYSDFECPFCKSFSKTPKQIIEQFDGQVNSVFRHYPLPFHDPEATDAALASECAADMGGNDAFWKFHDIYFERTNSNKGLLKSDLYAMASDIGVNKTQFSECIDSQKFIDKVQGDLAEGSQSGVTGTPGNILRNNETGDVIFLPGAYPAEQVAAAVNELLAK